MAVFLEFLLVSLTGLAVVRAAPEVQATDTSPELAIELNFSNAKMVLAWMFQRNPLLIENPISRRYQERFAELVKSKCKECEISELKDKYGVRKFRVTLKEQWYFDITLDPGVIEVTCKPIAVNKLPGIRGEMQRLIYDVAEELTLKPKRSGHMNFGISSSFDNNSLAFYNFLVDYLNNTGMTQGVLGYKNRLNAPHPEELDRDQRQALKRVLDEFDPKTNSVTDLAKRLYHEVYFRSPMIKRLNRGAFLKKLFGMSPPNEPAEKYHAVNIVSLVMGNTWPRVELRALKMQNNPEELELLANLFAARIKLSLARTEKILYTADQTFEKATPLSMIEDFHRYVVECGLNWEDYKPLVSKERKFARALVEFDNMLAARSCKQLFASPGL